MDVYQRRRLVALSAIAAIFIVFVLLIRSCGGDDTTTTPTPVAGATGTGGATSLSKPDYIEQADQICLGSNNSVAGVDVSAPTADTDLGKIVSNELEQLQSLPPPTDGTSDLDDFLSALDKQAKAYKQKGIAVQHGDATAAAEIDTTLDGAASDASDAASAFGFKVCGDLSKVNAPNSESTGSETSTSTSTDSSGGTVTPPASTTPVTPPATTPAVTPPATTPPTDGGTDSGSGGVSP
jgi:hypothetical protein